MTISSGVYTNCPESEKAAQEIAIQIKNKFQSDIPDVLIVFASPGYDQKQLLTSLRSFVPSRLLVGCSSSGEFTSSTSGINSISAIALKSNEMEFFASVGQGIMNDRDKVVDQLYKGIEERDHFQYKYHTAMLLADALSGYTDELIEKLTLRTAGTYQFFGGGAGDNAEFKNTSVFFEDQVISDGVVMLEILSNKPVGLGVSHGWEPGSDLLRVTEVEGSRIISMNAIPAVDVFRDYAVSTGQNFDIDNPISYFLHNIIGIKTQHGFKLRVPLVINEDGSVTCASDIPKGALVSIMTTGKDGAKAAAEKATLSALSQLEGNTSNIGIFFDCVATRLRLGNDFQLELNAVGEAFKNTPFVGCNTHGQVARMNGQFSGFHNCSAVVCVIPE